MGPVARLRMLAGMNVRRRSGRFFAGCPFRVPWSEIVGVAVRAIMRAQIQNGAHQPLRNAFAFDAIDLGHFAERASPLSRNLMAPHRSTPTSSLPAEALFPRPGVELEHSELIPCNLHRLFNRYFAVEERVACV